MIRLSRSQFQQFQEALCSAFDSREDFTQLTRFALNENLNAVAHGDNITHLAFELIQWAESQGRLQELIDGAIEQNSGNPQLKAFVESLEEAAQAAEENTQSCAEDVENSQKIAPPQRFPQPDMLLNPFKYGSPSRPEAFVGRRRELRRIVGRIVGNGESTALIGEPHIGKTSALHYLYDEAVRSTLYGNAAPNLCFSYLDAHTFAGIERVGEFWRRGLVPLAGLPQFAGPLQACADQGYSESGLEMLFRHLANSGYRMVLFIDELDSLLHHPVLNSAAFFGGLRGMASLSRGALAVVLASRLPLTQLNAKTQAINPSGSPYFNIYAEITLSALTGNDTDQLLDRADGIFSTADRRRLRQLTGGHPFLLQAAASALWDAYADEIEDSGERHQYMVERIHKELRFHFADTWRNWSPAFRQAYTSVALIELKGLLGQRSFQIRDFLDDLPNWEPELKELEYVGFVKRSDASRAVSLSGWRINQSITLAWLTDELTRAIRSENEFGQWLAESELEGRWTSGQRERLWNAGREMRNFTQELLLALAQGFGEGMYPGI